MLTNTRLKNLKPTGKAQKLADEKGMYAYISAAGAISFRYDYRIHGKRETLTLGRYPELSLAGAREKLREARKLVEQGESPARRKQLQNIAAHTDAGNTFKAVYQCWFDEKKQHRSRRWSYGVELWFNKDVLPAIGRLPVSEIKPAEVLAIMEAVKDRGAPKSAVMVRSYISQVFDWAISKLRATYNPAQPLRGAIALPRAQHRPPLTPAEIPAFIEALDSYHGTLQTKLGLKLLLLTFVRKGELTATEWDEIDFDAAEWRIPAERMKMQDPHIVPLARQALTCFRELKEVCCGSRFVLPRYSRLDKPMGLTTFNKALDTMGYTGRFSPHGVRSTASTILNEHGFRPDVIERQLAHTERNRVRAAYNRAEYLEERRTMMQHWADYIDGLVSGAQVVPIRGKVA